MQLGAHVTKRGGVEKAPSRAEEIGADTLQIFAKNQRRWDASWYDDDQITQWEAEMERTGMGTPCTHASYLINLCNDDEEGLSKSRAALVDELERAQVLSIPYVVVHPGAHKGNGVEWGIEQIAASLEAVLDEADAPDARPLLEPAAGEGSKIPHTFEQLAGILDALDDPDRVAVCLDTCHSFAAGYDLSTEAGYDDVVDRVDATVGLDRVAVWHLNDSRHPLDSRKDRHANLGEGEIGLTCFESLVNDDRFADTPGILETPIDEYTDYAEEIDLLRKLAR